MKRRIVGASVAFSSFAVLGFVGCLPDDPEPHATDATDAGSRAAATGGASTQAAGGASTQGTGGSATSAGGSLQTGGSGQTGGASGTSAAGAGSTPEAGPPPSDGVTVPHKGQSIGCGKARPGADSSTDFVLHDIKVSGVDPAFIQAHPASDGSWTDRTYFIRLPDGYDASKPYPISIGGGGCGATDGKSGNGGGLSALPKGEKVAIQVGLNYVYPQNAGACFADDYVNTPDLPYFDAILAELEANYCVDRDKVFVDGFSSGAWETYLLGCARAGVVRGIGTAEGGLRLTRPACAQAPVAAILVAGLQDTENPIGPLDPPGKNDSYGSAPARDDILERNGCVGRTTAPWDPAYPACVQYTGCPKAYPVVWCAIDAGHTDGGNYSSTGFWKFWSALP